MKAASCFSGIGAPELGGPQFDWLWHAEIEKFPTAVMAARFPHSVNLGDVTADDFLQRASAFGPLDLLVGGPPCQDFSVAGLRAGIAGDRGNLSLRFMEIAHAIRPRNLLVENVPGWLNMPDNAFGCFLGALVGADAPLLPAECRNWHWRHEPSFLPGPDGEPAECHSVGGRWLWEYCRWPSAGMVAGPRGRAAWRVFDAQYFGVAQRRRRVFVVADFGEGADPAAVLFERKGVSGNTPPRREAGQGTAGTISARTQGGGGLGTDFDLAGGLQPIGFGGGNCSGPIDKAACLTAKGQRIDFEVETFIAGVAGTLPAGGNSTGGDRQPGTSADTADTMLIAHSLRGEGFDASEDGTGRGTPIVPVAFAIQAGALRENPDSGPDGIGVQEGGAYTLEARAEVQAVAFAQNQRDELRTMDIAGALAAEPGMKQQTYVMSEPTVLMERGREGGGNLEYRQDGTANAILTPNGGRGGFGVGAIHHEWQVRRLTPTECARLQGFPDDHCAITYRGKPAADGPIYKSYGNSWAVPNGAWILARLALLLEQQRLAA